MLFGIDLGGTKTEGVVIVPSQPDAPLARIRIDTPQVQGYDAILTAVVDLVSSLESAVGSRAPRIGIGTPGVTDSVTRQLKNSNTQCLNGERLLDDLEARLGRPVVVENDANCFALAEARMGAARGSRFTFGIILGTGVGGAIVSGAKVWPGRQGIAGEWGHNVIEPGGTPCYCGKAGCVEATISGPALERYYAERAKQRLRLPQIDEKARTGDPVAIETMTRLVTYFGLGIATLVNVLDPDVIVLGGGVSNLDRLYSEGVDEARKHGFNNRPEVNLVRNQLGDSAGVFGAALLLEGSGG